MVNRIVHDDRCAVRNNPFKTLSSVPIPTGTRHAGIHVRTLGSRDFDLIGHFLNRDPTPHLFMISWLENYGVLTPGRKDLFQWVGVFENELEALALLINQRLLMLSCPGVQADNELRILASHFGKYEHHVDHIVSPAMVVRPFWDFYKACCPPPRLVREQKFLSLFSEDLTVLDRHIPRLRLAKKSDLDAVFFASAAMHVEESLDNPLEKNPKQFRRHIERRIEMRRTFVSFDNVGRLIFKADISAQSSKGSQISGIYVLPSMRRKGHAKRCLHDLCAILFSEGAPLLTLYVNSDNYPARKLYEGLGFEDHCDFLSVFVV